MPFYQLTILRVAYVSNKKTIKSIQGGNLNKFKEYVRNMHVRNCTNQVFMLVLKNYTFSGVITAKGIKKQYTEFKGDKRIANLVDNKKLFIEFFQLSKSNKISMIQLLINREINQNYKLCYCILNAIFLKVTVIHKHLYV